MEEATNRQSQPVPALIAALSLAIVATLATTAPGVARADDDKPLTPAQKKAGDLFELADTHYAAGRYEQAAKYFEQGYELAPHPEFLYSLGNTYERMGEYQKAADYLKRYVKSPLAEDVVSVRERIKRLEAAAVAKRAEQERIEREGETDDDDLEGDDDDDLVETPPEIKDEGSSSSAHYYWFAGAGVGLAAAATFGILSRNAATSAAASCDAAGLCEESARADLDREKQLALAADVSLGVGVAAAIVGAVVLIKNGSSKKSESAEGTALRLEPVITDDGGGVGVSGRF